jgi:quinol monooxygenase YgiN
MADTSPTDASDAREGTTGEEIEPVMVTMIFETNDAEAMLAVLSKYVVLSRMDPAARNIDLVASVTKPGRFTIIEKWATESAQQRHFDSPTMVEMAEACEGLLSAPPQIDLHEAVTMHDLE